MAQPQHRGTSGGGHFRPREAKVARAPYHLAALESQTPSPPPAGGSPAGSASRPAVAAPSPVPPRAQPQSTSGRGDPVVSALLSWILPGAGHAYLGMWGPALAAFAIVQGLYVVGLKLGGGMSFEYLDLELRSPLAPALSPEIGNLGAFIYQLKQYGFGPGFPRPFPEWLRVGSTLAALSGILNIVVIVHAHLCARTALRPANWRGSAAVAVAATLAVPGAGHWIQGRRARALVVFGLLVGLFVFGTVLAEATNLSRERHFYYWAGQFLVGLPAIVAEVLFGTTRVQAEIPYLDAGLVFGCIAGLLNTLAMIDVYGWAESKLFGWPMRASQSGSDPVDGDAATTASTPPAVAAAHPSQEGRP